MAKKPFSSKSWLIVYIGDIGNAIDWGQSELAAALLACPQCGQAKVLILYDAAVKDIYYEQRCSVCKSRSSIEINDRFFEIDTRDRRHRDELDEADKT